MLVYDYIASNLYSITLCVNIC